MKKKTKNKIDPMDCNVPNVCFSLIGKGDDRYETYKKQRLKRGFDDSETWNLDYVFVNFMLPRLKRYYEIAKEAIVIEGEFKTNLEIVIEGFELYLEHKEVPFSEVHLFIDRGNVEDDVKKIKEYLSKTYRPANVKELIKAYHTHNKVVNAFETFPKIIHSCWW